MKRGDSNLPVRIYWFYEVNGLIFLEKMKSGLYPIIMWIFLVSSFELLFAQDDVRIHFIVVSPTVPDNCEVYITGNHEALANWHPGEIRMHPGENGDREASIAVQRGTALQFKFTLGSWDREALDEENQPYPNFEYAALSDTTLFFSISKWKDGAAASYAAQVTGEVRYHRQINGEAILPHDLIVWLPPDYEKKRLKRFPVLYMQDGQNLFDPATATFGTDWQIDETADRLIRAGEIEPMIVVGIYNTWDRTREYTNTARGKAYRKFIVGVVKPFIDHSYRTKKGPEYTAIGGSSAGATAAFLLLWENPAVFSKAICISPAFYIDAIDCVTDVEAYYGPKKDITMYIDNGGIGLENQLQPGVVRMIAALERQSMQRYADYFWFIDRAGEHGEADWGRRMAVALKLFFGSGIQGLPRR